MGLDFTLHFLPFAREFLQDPQAMPLALEQPHEPGNFPRRVDYRIRPDHFRNGAGRRPKMGQDSPAAQKQADIAYD